MYNFVFASFLCDCDLIQQDASPYVTYVTLTFRNFSVVHYTITHKSANQHRMLLISIVLIFNRFYSKSKLLGPCSIELFTQLNFTVN
jgi:hypothetical protein